MAIHHLEIYPEPFRDILVGIKKAEVRDITKRPYKVGDGLLLKERVDERVSSPQTGRHVTVVITHIQKGFGLPDHMGVLSFSIVNIVVDKTP